MASGASAQDEDRTLPVITSDYGGSIFNHDRDLGVDVSPTPFSNGRPA